MSGGGGGGVAPVVKKAVTTAAVLSPTGATAQLYSPGRNLAITAIGYGKASKGRGWAGEQAQEFDPTSSAGLVPELPDPSAAPTMEDIAAKEPDKERRRRQRMAMLMAQGRQGTILTGPGGVTPNNSIGGGGKQMVGA